MVKFLSCVLLLLVAASVRAGEFGLFELHAASDKPSTTSRAYSYVMDAGEPPRKVFLEPEILLDGGALRSASLEHEKDNGQPRIRIFLTKEGAKRFGEITTRFVHQPLGIVVGGQLQSAPVIYKPILGGSFDVVGNFTEQQTADLVARLNANVAKPTE